MMADLQRRSRRYALRYGGGYYNERWKQEIDGLARLPTVPDVLRIRDALVVEFGLDQYR